MGFKDNSPKTVYFYTKYGEMSASTRERFTKYIPFLNKNNINVKSHILINDKIYFSRIIKGEKKIIHISFQFINRIFQIIFQKKKLLVIQYELLSFFPSILELYLKIRNIPYIIDLDDAVYLNYKKKFLYKILFDRKFKRILNWSNGIIVGNNFLKKEIKKFCKKQIIYLPTTVHVNISKFKKNHNFTVIWIGSPSTTKYLDDISFVIEYLSLNEDVRFKIIGSKNSKILQNSNIEFLDWSIKEEKKELYSSSLGIMPLRNTEWEKGKCGYKLLQYMSCSLPVIASPVGVNKKIVQKGITGYFANSQKDWIDYILKIKKDNKLGKKLGKNGKKKLLKDFELKKFSKDYVKFIKANIV